MPKGVEQSQGAKYKLKQQPEDFQVEELTDVAPTGQGPFALYRLEKRGWSTPDALAALRRRWKIEPRRLSYGGLKDRHALTIQYLTVFHGPRRGLTHQGVTITYLGQVHAPYTSADIRANYFRITLRNLTGSATADILRSLEEVSADGVPNYFDDQRFGSVTSGGDFVGRLLVLGRFEDALRLALTGPYEHDRTAQKQEKSVLRASWGDWAACKERLPRGHARSLVDYLLHHSGDFRGAVARLLRQHCRPEQLLPVALRLGEFPMYRGLDAEQRCALADLALPLPSARLHLDDADPRSGIVRSVLAEEGLEPSQLRVKGIRELYFSRGERAAVCRPTRLEHETGPDDLHAGRQRLVLGLELPRGCYATLIVKRITVAGETAPT